ncbi:MAG: nucleotide sugar dehydrogenase [Caldilineaceae bacterium]|nr:nucleotide sugar dehydrogenase [Caldilineaceae bacterium]
MDVDPKRVAGLNNGYSHVPDIPSEQLAALLKPPAAQEPERAAYNGHHHDGTGSHLVSDYHTENGHGHGNGSGSVFGAEAAPALPAVETATDTTHAASAETQPAQTAEKAGGSFQATTDYDILFDVDAVIICVPTPLSHTKDPDMSYIITAADEIARRLHHGMAIVLESTTYPGTTEEIVLPRLHRVKIDRTQLEVGKDFFLAFSPERIDPGRTDWTVQITPKVIGGITPQCLEVTKALYESALETVVPVSTTGTAEMVKLLENTFRAVNIALINEVAIMCDRLGVDVWEVIEAAKTKPFGYMPFYPGPGLGGHCIPIDPHYLAWKMKTLNYNARFIQLAAEINFGMPGYVLDKIADALNEQGKSLKNARILLLGVTYKADVTDLRESPALDLLHLLQEKGAQCIYHDPHISRLTLDGRLYTCTPLTETLLEHSDCVVIATAHSSYDWQWIMEHSKLIIDTRNATATVAATHPGNVQIVKL